MAYQLTTNVIGTIAAGADLSAKQFYGVKLSSGAAILATVAGEPIVGVLQNAPTSGAAAEIQIASVAKCWLGGTVTAGDRLTVTAAGKFIASVAGGDTIVGKALESGSDGGVIAVLLNPSMSAAGGAPAGRFTYCFSVALAGITAADVITAFTPGFAGTITKFFIVATTAVVTGSKAATLNIEIGTTNTTGGTIAMTSAGLDTLGKVMESSAFTAANTFTSTDTLSVEAASVTAFSDGVVTMIIQGTCN